MGVAAPAAGGAVLLSLVLFASLLAPALGGVAADPLSLPRLGISGAGANKFALFAGGYTNAYAIPYHPISVLLVLGWWICDESAVTSSAALMSSSFVPLLLLPTRNSACCDHIFCGLPRALLWRKGHLHFRADLVGNQHPDRKQLSDSL